MFKDASVIAGKDYSSVIAGKDYSSVIAGKDYSSVIAGKDTLVISIIEDIPCTNSMEHCYIVGQQDMGCSVECKQGILELVHSTKNLNI